MLEGNQIYDQTIQTFSENSSILGMTGIPQMDMIKRIKFDDYPKRNTEGQQGESSNGIRSNVRVSAFEQVEVHEDGKEVHVGRVELEVDAGGTEVVAGGHDPDHGEGEAHRVEQPVVEGYSCVLNLILLSLFKFKELLHPDHFDEKKTKDRVAYVAEQMVAHD